MPVRHLALAGVLCAIAISCSAEDLRPPSELPPIGFAGEQFVDSAGCVFLRAGVGERVTWVARISRERRQMCGQTPTFATAPIVSGASPEEVAWDISGAASKLVTPEQAIPVQRAEAVRKVPRAAAPARLGVQVEEVRDRAVLCPAEAPVAHRFAVKGGTKVLCIPEGVDLETFVLPKGYRRAWTDDRLNPLRGLGTAEGQAMQDRVWTRKVPAQPVAKPDAPSVKVAKHPATPRATAAASVTRSTSTAPADASGQYLVQVGSFGVPDNAQRARDRLAALGLPVTGGRGSIKGRAVQVVYVGPFAGTAAAQAALRKVRGAGFGDAFLR